MLKAATVLICQAQPLTVDELHQEIAWNRIFHECVFSLEATRLSKGGP